MPSTGSLCAPAGSLSHLDDLLDELQDVGAETAEFFQDVFQQLEQAWMLSAAEQLRKQQERVAWEQQCTGQFAQLRALLENLTQQLPGATSAGSAASVTPTRPMPLDMAGRRARRERYR